MSRQGKQIPCCVKPAAHRACGNAESFVKFRVPFKTIDELWAQEAESRIDAYERGEITAIPAKKVFEKIEKLRD